MHSRQPSVMSATTGDNLSRSGGGGVDSGPTQTTSVNGKHLICLRDLTKHRGMDAELSPRELKYVPPSKMISPQSSVPGPFVGRPSSSVDGRSNSDSPSSETASTRPLVGSPPVAGRHSNGPVSDRSTPKSSSVGAVAGGDQEGGVPTGSDRSPSRPGETRSPTGATTAVTAGGCDGQLNKLKRFLATVQQFADDVSPDIGDRVRSLVLALVNSQLSAEEFHRRLQEATNFPLRPFVVPFLKANLPLLQLELTAANGSVRSPLPSPTGPDRPALVPAVRPTTGALQRDGSTTTLLTGTADQRQRGLWYLGGLVPSGTAALFARGLDLNGNGKRPSAFDRVCDSPVDLKLDLFSQPNPAKRLHIDIPGPQRSHIDPAPPPFVFNPTPLALRPEESNSAPADRSSERRHVTERDRGQLTGNSASHFSRCPPGPNVNAAEEFEDDWHNVEGILQNIVTMVDRCRQAMVALRDQCRRDGRHPAGPLSNGSGPGVAAGLGPTRRSSPGGGDAGLPFNGNSFRLADDLQVLQVRQLAEEAVSEVKRQAVAELHRAVAAAEVKATVTVTAERARLEKVINDVRAQARQEAFAILNSQEDSTENCWNCGRKAYETCSGCHRARYCGTFCQHRHWETHHLTCKATQQQQQQSNPASRLSPSPGIVIAAASGPDRRPSGPGGSSPDVPTCRRPSSDRAVGPPPSSSADTPPAIDFSTTAAASRSSPGSSTRSIAADTSSSSSSSAAAPSSSGPIGSRTIPV